MSDLFQRPARRPTRRRLLRRLAKWGGATILIMAAYVAYLCFGHLPHVWAYDSAYEKLTVGNPLSKWNKSWVSRTKCAPV